MAEDWTADFRVCKQYPRLSDRSLVCLSHLRWDLVTQRPQHLMARFARIMPVYFVEEPAFEDVAAPFLARYRFGDALTVLVPHLPAGTSDADATAAQQKLLTAFSEELGAALPVLWLYTPAAVAVAGRMRAAAIVYDCMDELSGFRDAPPQLHAWETELLDRADLVFTGGFGLYEAKRNHHRSVHAFPSGVDAGHFGRARRRLPEPADQADIPHPRIGFFGVIDERLDRDLVAAVARLRPEWQLVLVGPVVKIEPASLPQAPNIHYLGRKSYDELPAYIGGWDAAMMPFARNGATRFISPTKTPEYLAAGKPVVSTPISDVVRSWSHLDAVRIAATPEAFVAATERALDLPGGDPGWLAEADRELQQMSWDRIWGGMAALVEAALAPTDGAPAHFTTGPVQSVNEPVRV